MAIPTTLLVDERGTIRWIDQTEDYRVRSGRARVLAAVDAVFGDSRLQPSSSAPTMNQGGSS